MENSYLKNILAVLSNIVIIDTPIREVDIHSLVATALSMKGIKYNYIGTPGKEAVDFIINGKIGLEVKLYRDKPTSQQIDRLIGQVIRYKNEYVLDFVIMYIVCKDSSTVKHVKEKLAIYKETLKKNNIIPLVTS